MIRNKHEIQSDEGGLSFGPGMTRLPTVGRLTTTHVFFN